MAFAAGFGQVFMGVGRAQQSRQQSFTFVNEPVWGQVLHGTYTRPLGHLNLCRTQDPAQESDAARLERLRCQHPCAAEEEIQALNRCLTQGPQLSPSCVALQWRMVSTWNLEPATSDTASAMCTLEVVSQTHESVSLVIQLDTSESMQEQRSWLLEDLPPLLARAARDSDTRSQIILAATHPDLPAYAIPASEPRLGAWMRDYYRSLDSHIQERVVQLNRMRLTPQNLLQLSQVVINGNSLFYLEQPLDTWMGTVLPHLRPNDAVDTIVLTDELDLSSIGRNHPNHARYPEGEYLLEFRHSPDPLHRMSYWQVQAQAFESLRARLRPHHPRLKWHSLLAPSIPTHPNALPHLLTHLPRTTGGQIHQLTRGTFQALIERLTATLLPTRSEPIRWNLPPLLRSVRSELRAEVRSERLSEPGSLSAGLPSRSWVEIPQTLHPRQTWDDPMFLMDRNSERMQQLFGTASPMLRLRLSRAASPAYQRAWIADRVFRENFYERQRTRAQAPPLPDLPTRLLAEAFPRPVAMDAWVKNIFQRLPAEQKARTLQTLPGLHLQCLERLYRGPFHRRGRFRPHASAVWHPIWAQAVQEREAGMAQAGLLSNDPPLGWGLADRAAVEVRCSSNASASRSGLMASNHASGVL